MVIVAAVQVFYTGDTDGDEVVKTVEKELMERGFPHEGPMAAVGDFGMGVGVVLPSPDVAV
jgi:hypothetical protein